MSETEEKPDGKSETSMKLSSVESKKTHSKPSFKLYFVLCEELGRSYILPYRQKKTACEYEVYYGIMCRTRLLHYSLISSSIIMKSKQFHGAMSFLKS
jgi:hypothetical protein